MSSKIKVLNTLHKLAFAFIFLLCAGCNNTRLLHIVDTSLSARGENADTGFIENAKRNCLILAKYSSPNDFFEIIPAIEKNHYTYDLAKIRSRKDSKERCNFFFDPDNLKLISATDINGSSIETSTDACIVFDRVKEIIDLTSKDKTKGVLVIYQIQVDDNRTRKEYCYEKASKFADFLRDTNGIMLILGSEDISTEQHTNELFSAFSQHRDVVSIYESEDVKDEIRKAIDSLR